jgi:hypothetical protein
MLKWFPIANTLVAGIIVTVGFTMVWNPIPLPWAAGAGLGFTALLWGVGKTPRHTWAWACLFLGLESLSWPAVELIKLRMAGILEPSAEHMPSLVGNLFLGIFFATFWLTFAYGIFRWIRRSEEGARAAKP